MWIVRGLGIELGNLGGRLRGRLDVRKGAVERTYEAGRESSARSITAENYSGVESFGETKVINRPPSREADWATTLYSACNASDQALTRDDCSEGGE